MKEMTFSNVGRGISAAADWFEINGKREWVSFMAWRVDGTDRYSARKNRCTWEVTASFHNDNGDTVRASAIVGDCYRYNAADAALAALTQNTAVPATCH